ncbi:MAG: response regulator [bacterium]
MSYQDMERNENTCDRCTGELSAEPFGKTRVVLVNCSDAERESIRRIIERDAGISVIGMARNEHEARRMIRNLDPDLVIMDILDPESGGIGFLRRLHHFCPKPVILLSPMSKMTFSLVLSAFKVGAYEIIDKENLDLFDRLPSSRDLFLAKIKRIASQFSTRVPKDSMVFH